MRATLLILLTVFAGCSAPRKEPPTISLEPGIYPVYEADAELDIFARVAAARVVLVAESHDSADDHAVQLEILQGVSGNKPTALGMEMFQRPFQPALDMFVAGAIDEAEMLEQTEWEERWGFATELYRPLWQHARDRGIPIVALNAPRELTKRIAKVGVEGLSDAERAELPELDLSDERYRAWLKGVFKSHGAKMDDAALERFYQAQVTWDETMAEVAAAWSEAHPDATLVVAAGRGHIERDWGIPSRLRRRLGAQPGDGTVLSIVPLPRDEVPRWSWMRRERFADYLWVY